MFLAFCSPENPKDPTSKGPLLNYGGLIAKLGLGFVLAEGLSYPLALLRTRECSYPRKKGLISKAVFNNKLYFGFFASLQRSLMTFLLRAGVMSALSGRPQKLVDQLPIDKLTESGILAAAAASLPLNLWNVVLIKAQCSGFGHESRKASFINIIKEIGVKQGSRFAILRTGFLSYTSLQTLQAVSEFRIFMHFHTSNPDTPVTNIAKTAFIVTFATGPLEFLNGRYVLRKLKGLETPNIANYAFLIAKREGGRALYRGCGKMFLRSFIFNSVLFRSISPYVQIH